MSIEKRKYRRIPVKMDILIDSLYKQDDLVIQDVNEEIHIVNLSKSGVGFVAKNDFPADFYFNAKIIMDDERHFYGVLKIIRKAAEYPEKAELQYGDEYTFYGCEFIGLADILSSTIDDYAGEHAM
jgi:hypothetical protein